MGEVADDPLRQGRQALAAAEWAVARAQFERCLDEGGGTDALAGLGEALQWLGEYDRAIELKAEAFDLYRRAGDGERAAEVARSLALLHGGVYGNLAAANGWLRPGRERTGRAGGVHPARVAGVRPCAAQRRSGRARTACPDRAGDRPAVRRRRPRVRRDGPAGRRLCAVGPCRRRHDADRPGDDGGDVGAGDGCRRDRRHLLPAAERMRADDGRPPRRGMDGGGRPVRRLERLAAGVDHLPPALRRHPGCDRPLAGGGGRAAGGDPASPNGATG